MHKTHYCLRTRDYSIHLTVFLFPSKARTMTNQVRNVLKSISEIDILLLILLLTSVPSENKTIWTVPLLVVGLVKFRRGNISHVSLATYLYSNALNRKINYHVHLTLSSTYNLWNVFHIFIRFILPSRHAQLTKIKTSSLFGVNTFRSWFQAHLWRMSRVTFHELTFMSCSSIVQFML